MGAEDVHIREQELHGIGRRFDLDVDDGLTLIVVARRDGSRDVAVSEKGADAPRGSVHLGREQAVAVGSLLLGAWFSDGGGDSGGRTLDVSTVVLGPRSPAIGRIPAEIPLPGDSEAAVVRLQGTTHHSSWRTTGIVRANRVTGSSLRRAATAWKPSSNTLPAEAVER